jgi:type IV secretory pathway VirB10-like protein
MTDKAKEIDPVVIENEPVVDVDVDSKGVSSSGVSNNAKYITIGVSVVLSIVLYFFVFSGGNKEDIVDPNQIVVETKTTGVPTRGTIDNIESVIGTGDINYNDRDYVSGSDREIMELPELPQLPPVVNEEIEREIQITNQKKNDSTYFSKTEVDDLINSKLKTFEEEMNRIRDESEKLSKELERKKLEEEEARKNRRTLNIFGNTGADVQQPPGGTPPAIVDGLPQELIEAEVNLEEQRRQEERDLQIAQRARIMEERKGSPMFKMQGGGGGSSKNEEQDSIIVADKDSLQTVKEENSAAVTTKTADLSRSINQGKIINAILETAINTDVQAQVRAVVSRDIYSQLGKNILIPKGSRIIGAFQAVSGVGVSRIGINWTRIIRTDGLNITITSNTADNLGRGGIEGDLDNKYTQVMRNALLSSMVTIASAAVVDKVTDTVSTTTTSTGITGTTTSSTTNATNQSIIDAAKSFTDEMKDLVDNLKTEKPTIRIPQGTKVNIIVNKDLTLPIFKQKK